MADITPNRRRGWGFNAYLGPGGTDFELQQSRICFYLGKSPQDLRKSPAARGGGSGTVTRATRVSSMTLFAGRMLGSGVALSQAGPGPLPMMRHCPEKQNTETTATSLSPETIPGGKRPRRCEALKDVRLRDRARVLISTEHAVRGCCNSGSGLCVNKELCRVRNRKVIKKTFR